MRQMCMAWRTLGGALLLVSLASGCSEYVKRGSTLYADGRYIEAAEVFERTEYRLPESSPREQAEYSLYRGMTMLVLGDLRNAQRWLQYSYEVERVNPGSLRPHKRALLDRGWFELGQRVRGGFPPVQAQPDSQPDTAIASSQPARPIHAAPDPQTPQAPANQPAPQRAPEQQRSLLPR